MEPKIPFAFTTNSKFFKVTALKIFPLYSTDAVNLSSFELGSPS